MTKLIVAVRNVAHAPKNSSDQKTFCVHSVPVILGNI
jgi:hypothetical protein